MAAFSLSGPSCKDARDPNGLGQVREFGFDLSLVLGHLCLLYLDFFEQREQALLILCIRRLCRHRSGEQDDDEGDGKKCFHREMRCSFQVASHVPPAAVDLAN